MLLFKTLLVSVGFVSCIIFVCYIQSCSAAHIEIKPLLHSHECSRHEHNRSNVECLVAHIAFNQTDVSTPTSLLNLLSDISEYKNGQIHKMNVEFVNASQLSAESLIDQFLMVHNWWVIRKEVYDSTSIAAPGNTSSSKARNNVAGSCSIQSHLKPLFSTHFVILVRYNVRFEPILRSVSARQYIPTQNICDKTPLMIVRNLGSGWGSQSDMWQHHLRIPYAIGNVWFSRNNSVDESVNICHVDDCAPDLVNKWECIFLPLTNCSFSIVKFTRCHTLPSEPLNNEKCFGNSDFFKVSTLDSDGEITPAGSHGFDEIGRKPVTQYQELTDVLYKASVDAFRSIGKGSGWMIMENKPFFTAAHKMIRYQEGDVTRTLTNFGLTFRPNAMLRRRIRWKLNELLAGNWITPELVRGMSGVTLDMAAVASAGNVDIDTYTARHIQDYNHDHEYEPSSCIAIHIRRGDRTRHYGITMDQFCRRYTNGGRIQGHNCSQGELDALATQFPMKNNLLRDLSCPMMADVGCWSLRPFGALSLADYIAAAELIISVGKTSISSSGSSVTATPRTDVDISNLSRHQKITVQRHAFVMTDDAEWLEDEISGLAADMQHPANLWTVGRLPIEKNARSDKNGTRYSVDFWTSVAIARHCTAFVGHFGSAITRFVYDAMCFQHGGVTGDCPVAADVGGNILR